MPSKFVLLITSKYWSTQSDFNLNRTTFIKFGIGRATHDASQEIRNGEINRDEAISLIKQFDGEYPLRFSEEIFKYLSIDQKTFGDIYGKSNPNNGGGKFRWDENNIRHIESKNIITTDHPYVIRNKASSEIQEMPIWIIKWLNENLTKNIIKKVKNNFSKKIYIDRGDSTSNQGMMRKITNDQEIKFQLEIS